jgi:hypothetical protein
MFWYLCSVQCTEAVDMNGRFQMQGGKNWFLPKEIYANRFFCDSHWLEIWSNHFYPSMGPNGGSVAMDSVERKLCTVCALAKTEENQLILEKRILIKKFSLLLKFTLNKFYRLGSFRFKCYFCCNPEVMFNRKK